MRTLPLVLVLVLALSVVAPGAAFADEPPAAEEPASAVEPDSGTVLYAPWQERLLAETPHHLWSWGLSTTGLLGLETGFFLAAPAKAPGWFQGATVNLMFMVPVMSGFFATALIDRAIRGGANAPRTAHYLRRASITAAVIGTGMINLMVVLMPPLNWAGQFPQQLGLIALPASAIVVAAVLAHWSVLVDQSIKPRPVARGRAALRPPPRVVAASPLGLVVHF